MQKLGKRTVKQNTPTNTSLVRSNCGLPLNKEETLSVSSSKTFSNNPEVNQHQRTGGPINKVMVYVLSINSKPLMPCTPGKARKLLKTDKAKVIKRIPFTIKLIVKSPEIVQEVNLGVDSGFNHVGISCISNKQELFAIEVELDDKTSSRLTERRMYRRNRRSRLWYRKPRFLNRKKKEGWLPPSIQRKYDTHLRLINLAKKLLPL